jgi:hypothetical protein
LAASGILNVKTAADDNGGRSPARSGDNESPVDEYMFQDLEEDYQTPIEVEIAVDNASYII